MRNNLHFSPIERTAFILPAITLFFALCAWTLVKKLNAGPLPTLDALAKHSGLSFAILSVSSVAIIFMLAHILDTLSSSFYERFLSDKLQGFPHERIVPIAKTTVRYRQFIRNNRTRLWIPRFLYEGVKSMVFCGFALVLFGLWLRHPSIQQREYLLAGFQAVFWLSFSGLVFSFIFLGIPFLAIRYLPFGRSYSYRRLWAIRLVRGIQKAIGRRKAFRYLRNSIVGILVWIPAKAHDFLDRILRALFRLNKEIDIATYERLELLLKEKVGLEFSKLNNNDRFWVPYLILVEHSKVASRDVIEMWKKAAFCRNQALALLLSSLLLGTAYRLHQPDIDDFLTKNDLDNLALLAFFGSQFFCYRFYQHYYYFTKLVYRAFASIPAPTRKPKMPNPAVQGTLRDEAAQRP